VTIVRIREHIFALSIHVGIILCIGILVTATSCGEPEPPPVEPDPVSDFFDNLQDGLDDAGAETVIVMTVIDNAGVGEDLPRQIFQEIQTQLDNLNSVSIVEQPRSAIEELFLQMDIDPLEGISPEQAMDLAARLETDALIFASVESDAPDVHIKIYSGSSGAVTFAETLQEWPLPVTTTDDPMDDLFDEPAETPEPEIPPGD